MTAPRVPEDSPRSDHSDRSRSAADRAATGSDSAVGLGELASTLAEAAPLLRRAVGLDPRVLARLRAGGARVEVLVALPFRVLAGRALAAPSGTPSLDLAVSAAELMAFLDGDRSPVARDHEWRGGVAPADGWRRVETVDGETIRGLVRQGALALRELPGERVDRTASAEALLDGTALTVRAGARDVTISLRLLSALTRMGFLPRGEDAHVDVAARWVRVVGRYGSVYAERPGEALTVVQS